jgi:hypothetical protein
MNTLEILQARKNIFMKIMYAADAGNSKLNARLNDLRHLMNDQLIELKYGKGYKASFMDEVLIQVENI